MQSSASIHHDPSPPAARRGLFTSELYQVSALVFLCILLVLTLYVWLISVGTWTHWPTRWYSYDALATSIGRGHLWLDEKPAPALLALSDPYDPAARQGVPYPQDASLYKGRFYLYFGPMPALLLLPAKALIAGRIGDQYLVFLFMAGIFLIQSFMLVSIRSRFFSDAPPWTLVPIILAGGLMNPMGWVLSTPSVYNAAIAAGQFFFLAGLLAAFSAFAVRTVSTSKLALAGLLWVAALGSRITLILPIAFMTLIILSGIALIPRPARGVSESQRPASALLIILAIGLGALCWYNWARFGSPFETGIKYQLAGVPLQAYGGKISSPLFAPQNLYNYFLNLPRLKYAFPYFNPVPGITRSVISSLALPTIYQAQEITGLLYTAPFLPLAVLPLVSVLRRRTGGPITTDDRRMFAWLILALAGSFLFSFAFFVTFFWAAERYMLDFLPCLFILSMIGFWQLDRWLEARPRGRILYRILFVGLAIASIIIGILLSMTFNSDGFRQLDPLLWRQLGNLFRP
jgi:hypothetical protein